MALEALEAQRAELMALYKTLAEAAELRMSHGNNNRAAGAPPPTASNRHQPPLAAVAASGSAGWAGRSRMAPAAAERFRRRATSGEPHPSAAGTGLAGRVKKEEAAQGLVEAAAEFRRGMLPQQASVKSGDTSHLGRSGSGSMFSSQTQLGGDAPTSAVHQRAAGAVAEDWRSGFVPVAPLLMGLDTVSQMDEVRAVSSGKPKSLCVPVPL